MRIGFLGNGAIGSAISGVHESLGQSVVRHDLTLGTNIKVLLACDVIFVCLPTPQSQSGQCDLSIIDRELKELDGFNYQGVVVMKSTVPPGTGERYARQYGFQYASCPEFLREHNAMNDYMNQGYHLIGTSNGDVPQVLVDALSVLSGEIVAMTLTDAELTKYFHNTFNAWRIVFANAFADLTSEFSGSYDKVLSAFCQLNNFPSTYLKSNPEFQGFGGPCLPKDTAALAYIAKQLSLPSNIWAFALAENDKRVVTLPDGLRENGFKSHDMPDM